MSKEVARWDKITFLDAVPKELQAISEQFINRLEKLDKDEIYKMEWSEIKIEKKPQITAKPRLSESYPFLQYCAKDPHIWLKVREMDHDGSPFHSNRQSFVGYFKGLYDPDHFAKQMKKYNTIENVPRIIVLLKHLKSPDQFELFIKKLYEFKEFVERLSKGENATMQMNSSESEQGAKYSEEPPQIQASNLIFYGPPGTGKTYKMQQLFEKYMSKTDNQTVETEPIEDVPEATELLQMSHEQQKSENVKRFEFITFHQSYSYEEFIEGIRPVMDNSADSYNSIAYRIEDGIFKRICDRASRDPDNNYALFIDEINRGNISKIFGELITLVELDKCLDAKHELRLTLPYSKEEFGVPKNLSIIGSMNTADRSIALVDIALRRRFEFVEMMPMTEEIDPVEGFDASALMETINRRIECLYDRDHVIGHADFMGVPTLDALRTRFLKKIIPLLQEYFYGDWRKICLVLGCPSDDDGVQQNPATAIIRSASLGLGYETDQYEGNAVAFTINPQFKHAKDSDLELFFIRILSGQ